MRGQPLGEPAYGLVVGEPDGGRLEAVAAVDVDLVGSVDEHVGDAGLPEQRLERPGAEHVATQRLVDGEHRGVADRATRLPASASATRCGDSSPGRSASRSRTRSTISGSTSAMLMRRAPWGARPARSSRARRGRAVRDATGPGPGRGRGPRRGRAGRPWSRAPGAPTSAATRRGSAPRPRTTSRTRPGSGERGHPPGGGGDPGHGRHDDQHDQRAPRDRLGHEVARAREVDDHGVVAAAGRRQRLADRAGVERRRRGGPAEHAEVARGAAPPRAASAR